MKTDEQRPRGRRSLLRGLALALLALVAPGVASDAAGSELTGPAPRMTSIPGGMPTVSIAAGPDGQIWSLEGDAADGFRIARYGATRRLTAVAIPGDDVRSALTPLANGGMGLVVAEPESLTGRTWIAYVRTDARGLVVSSARLPRAAWRGKAFAVAGDETLWFVDTCANRLYRWHAGQRLTSVALPGGRCNQYAETRTSLAAGPDGSVWFADSIQGRIVRRDVRGKLREWRFRPDRYTWWPPTVVVDPRGGGAVFTDATPDGSVSGWITRGGNLLSWDRANRPAFGSDGALWFAGRGGLTSLTPRAGRGFALPRGVTATDVTIGRDGAPWFLAGTIEAPPSAEAYVADVELGTVGGAALSRWPLGRPGSTPMTQPLEPAVPLVLGGDGALWTRVERGWGTSTIVRAVPAALKAPRRPTARATRLLARGGRIATVQVTCAADRGRFCRGSLRLRGAAAPVAYIAPGQSGAAVRLTLGSAAARALRRGRAVRTTAVVSSVGASATRTAVTVR